ncbi:MAG: hypothetical protein OXC91_10725 [Rhodobacteraceae bacterium]|nr:hypothetical protein [Paracoccaceae bacterium]
MQKPGRTCTRLPAVLVLISGPARAGKTRAGRLLAAYLGADHFALSDELKRMTHRHYGLAAALPPHHYETVKDSVHDDFRGLSPRCAYIDYSENILKPRLGNDYLGQHAAKKVSSNLRRQQTTIVSGVGFTEEILPLIAVAGNTRTLHIRILPRSPDHPVLIDSRSPLELRCYGVDEIVIKSPHAYTLASKIRRRLQAMGQGDSCRTVPHTDWQAGLNV